MAPVSSGCRLVLIALRKLWVALVAVVLADPNSRPEETVLGFADHAASRGYVQDWADTVNSGGKVNSKAHECKKKKKDCKC